MATKPTATFTHATNLNFSLGPAAGFPTKLPVPDVPNGFVPGTGVSAEQVNQQFNILGDWLTNWLILGSAAPGLDAHIVETDALGVSRVASVILGGTAGGDGALVVSTNAGATAFAANFTNSAGGFAVVATASGALAAVRGTNTGPAAGVQGVNVGGGGPGVEGSGDGAGAGVIGVGGSGGGSGGIFAGAGGTGHGVEASASGADASAAIFTGATASTEATVQVLRTGGGAPARGSIFLEPSAEPTNPEDGDIWKRPGAAGFGRGRVQWWDDDGGAGGGSPGVQTAWSTEGGMGYGYADSLGDSSENAGVATTKVSTNLGANTSPGLPGGDYIIEFSGLTRISAGLASRTMVEFHDAGGLIDQVEEDYAALGQKKSFFFQHKITLPPGGTNLLRIRFYSVGGAGTSVISQAKIVARGAYE